MKYIHKDLTFIGIIFFFLTIIFSYLVLNNKIVDILWLFNAAFIVVFFFVTINILSHNWQNIDVKYFMRNLFFVSFVFQLVSIIVFYYYYLIVLGEPFEYYAQDSKTYHALGEMLADNFSNGNFTISNTMPSAWNYSDYGYPSYLGFLYFVFGKIIIIPRIINCLFGSLTVLLIYQTGKMFFDMNVARISAIIYLCLPNTLYYSGLHLKETLMVFLVMLSIYSAYKIVSAGKLILLNWLFFLVSVFSLFFFRTILPVIIIFSLIAYFVFPGKGSKNNALQYLSFFILLMILLTASTIGMIQNEIEPLSEKVNSSIETGENDVSRGDVALSTSLKQLPVNFAISLISPLPGFVYKKEREAVYLMIGPSIIKIFYSFFSIIGLYFAIRKRIKSTMIVFMALLIYLLSITYSGFFLFERFQFVATPFMVLFCGLGMQYLSKNINKLHLYYLAGVLAFILYYNASK